MLVVFLPLSGFAQDSLFQAKFEQNLSELNGLYCWSDSAFSEGEFSYHNDFDRTLQQNTLFQEHYPSTLFYLQYLNDLTLFNKQHLIAYFSLYEPFFEKQFKQAGLPVEIKYLAPALSAMNPRAIGDNKRSGIWNLNHFQGVLNGLQISRLLDERLNERMATRAAVNQFKQNKVIFGSNELAVLAFLVGNARLQNTLARCANKTDISEILRHLPNSVAQTLAMYQAMSVFLQQNTFKPQKNAVLHQAVTFNRQLHFQQISQVLGISEQHLQFLNPQYRYSIVPGDENEMTLLIPEAKYEAYISELDSIYSGYDSARFELVSQKIEYPPTPNRQYAGEKVKDLEIEGKTKIRYTIKPGDVLGFIAEDYNVRVADLKYWNNIYNERKIQAGKSLDIFVDDEEADYYRSVEAEKKKTKAESLAKVQIEILKNAHKVEHTVKSGESPYLIAKKYEGVTPEAILEWNGIEDARKIQIGQKLIIYVLNK